MKRKTLSKWLTILSSVFFLFFLLLTWYIEVNGIGSGALVTTQYSLIFIFFTTIVADLITSDFK
jgi:hypothetical protein